MSLPVPFRTILVIFLAVCLASSAKAQAASASDHAATVIRYTVHLSHPERHLVQVSIALPAGAAERDLQLPVWNALYQVRDFSQFVDGVTARDNAGRPLAVRLQDKSRWRISGAEGGALVQYEIVANQPGPYGAQLNEHHAFFNLAETLMYPVDARSFPVLLDFDKIPAGWRTATTLAVSRGGSLTAENYDRLVDAPVELGSFQESDFDEAGGHYRVVVDADPGDYDMGKIVALARRIVVAATTWMNDRPFETYLFIYHFPREPGGGGMEHAYSTAIDVNAGVLATDPQALADVTAHEFFHLWNVKRIRPKSLETVDYTEENYSDALWFSEGVTNTVQNYILLRAGLIDERAYLNRLAENMEELEQRPAHLVQSAEESSLDAWLEKYPAYREPARSISYYNKGDLLGVLLDLQVREDSQGMASLRDMFQWMNQNYAHQGRSFPDSEGVRLAAEAVGHDNLQWLFRKYVAGTEEIPWNDFFKTVGLQAVRSSHRFADLGFATAEKAGSPTVSAIDSDGQAAVSGLTLGDTILEINGRVASSDVRRQLIDVRAGDVLHLRVRNPQGEREVTWKVGSREQVDFELKDVDGVTPAQKARRAAWLNGEDQSSQDQPTQNQPTQNQPSGGTR